GKLTFEFGDAKLSSDTQLSTLNGGAGVQRGRIRITDRSGASSVIDLSQALSIDDVVEAINGASGINVTASVEGDHLKLADNTGGAGNFTVAEVGTTTTAASLGIKGSVAAAGVTGTQINTIGAATALSALNDGNGVRRKGSGSDDLAITRSDGST